jgi:peptidoglycan hydrolase CwlO-like protein
MLAAGLPFWKIGLGVLLAIVLMAAATTIGRNYPNSAVIERLIEQTEEKIKAEYEAKMTQKDAEIEALQKNIEVSQEDVKKLEKKIAALRKAYSDIKPPASSAEMRKRFTDLGYPPEN